jgi:hypothetical protein
MLIARFGPSTGWQGRMITYEDGRFVLQDHGVVPAEALLEYDRQGQLDWDYPGLREWVHGLAAPAASAAGLSATPAAAGGKFPVWAIVAIVLGVIVLGGGFLSAIFIPMFLGQQDKAHESAVKEGIHSIQVGVQSFAVDNNDAYPDPAIVSQGGLGSYVDVWPTNPYTGRPMAQGSSPGDFTYVVSADGGSFELLAYGQDGRPVITVP